MGDVQIPSWVDHLVYEWHPFRPSSFKGTPAEVVISGKDRMAWCAIDRCGNIVGVEEADWLELPDGFDPDKHAINRDGIIPKPGGSNENANQ